MKSHEVRKQNSYYNGNVTQRDINLILKVYRSFQLSHKHRAKCVRIFLDINIIKKIVNEKIKKEN